MTQAALLKKVAIDVLRKNWRKICMTTTDWREIKKAREAYERATGATPDDSPIWKQL